MVIVRLASPQRSRRVFISLHDAEFDGMPFDQPDDTPLRNPRAELQRFAQDTPTGDVVQDLGRKLFGALDRHPTVSRAMALALSSDSQCPIYLKIDSETAAEYPWEALFDSSGGRFLALQEQWPIARMMPGVRTPRSRSVTLPVRMVAVLSAVGVPAQREWESLRAAVESTGFDVRLHVVVGERPLYEKLAAERLDWLSCEPLARDDTVQLALKRVEPHLVHFFCHGETLGTPMLALGTALAHEPLPGVAPTSDVHITAVDLKGAARLPWLVTLNCCSGAGDAEGVRSLATQLVLEGGYPAALGMREPILDRDASLFCGRFYAAAFARLEQAFAGKVPFVADWTGPLCSARQALRNAYANGMGPTVAAAQHRMWTVPIMCVAPAPLTIEPLVAEAEPVEPDLAAHLIMEIRTLERLNARLSASAAGHAEIEARIEELRAQLGDGT